jgi:Tfp pilus assembly PilM family ATPase
VKTLVALDISSNAIRAAEIIGPTSKMPKVSKIGEIDLPPGIAGESSVHNVEAFAELLKELWSREGFTTKSVALAVSGRRFIVREHETNHTSMKDLIPVIALEASGVIPPQMSNPVVYFYPNRHIQTKTGVKTSGLIIATPAEPIETLVGAIIRAGLNVEFVDFSPMAIARFISCEMKAPEGYALVNIREDSTDILLAKDNIPRMIRVTPKGLEPHKKRVGRHAVDEVSLTSLNPSGFSEESPSASLAREINMTISSQSEELNIDISTIYLTGPRSTDEELIALLQGSLGIKTVSLSADAVSTEGRFDEDLSSSDFVAVCTGMRGKK